MAGKQSGFILAAQINSRHNVYGAMQLQKLMYYAEAWALVLGGSLFTDEIEAWDDGPVVREVHRHYKYSRLDAVPVSPSDTRQALLDVVIPFYGSLSGRELSIRTHNELPWNEAYSEGQNTVIDRSTMRRFYAKQAILEPDMVPELPSIKFERPPLGTVEDRAKEISSQWERTLTILGS